MIINCKMQALRTVCCLCLMALVLSLSGSVFAAPRAATAAFVSSCPSSSLVRPPPRQLLLVKPTAVFPTHHKKSVSKLCYTRYDSLISGIAEISLGTSLGVLWSEYAILTTNCGPLNLSDGLERFCYQVVIVVAALVLLTRIVAQRDVATRCQDLYGSLLESTLVQVRLAELLVWLAVLGAFVALAMQMYSGQHMEGLSGIDVQMCRAIRDL